MRTLRTGIWIKTRPSMVNRQSSIVEQGQNAPHASPLTPYASRASGGFTLIEMLAVLALFGVALAIIVPRFGIGDPLAQTSRQFVGLLHAVKAKAPTTQKSWRLYLDVDQRTFWTTVMEPDGERTPTDAALAERFLLPPAVRFLEVMTLRQGTFQSGQGYLQVLPTGQMEPGVIHLADDGQNVVAIQIRPVTGQIRLWEQRIELKPADPIPERLRPLLQPFGTMTSKPSARVGFDTVRRETTA